MGCRSYCPLDVPAVRSGDGLRYSSALNRNNVLYAPGSRRFVPEPLYKDQVVMGLKSFVVDRSV